MLIIRKELIILNNQQRSLIEYCERSPFITKPQSIRYTIQDEVFEIKVGWFG